MNRALKRQQAKATKQKAKNILLVGTRYEKLAHGAALQKKKHYAEALRCYNNALASNPNDVDALYLKGAVLIQLEDLAGAEIALKTCLSLAEATAAAHHNLGLVYHEQSKFTEAERHFARALVLEPHNRTTQFFLARAQEKNNDKSSQPYIKLLYDAAATLFEENLVSNLAYDGPAKLLKRLQPFLPPKLALGVDLGCGTGLMGGALKPFVEKLYGVDLSEKMVEEAAKKNVYDQLEATSLETYLRTTPYVFNLIAAADVFIYLETLGAVFKHIGTCLAAGGLFAFTTETLGEDAPQDIWLDVTNNRHKHKNSYIKKLAAQNGLTLKTCEEDFLRNENKKPVTASYFVFEKMA